MQKIQAEKETIAQLDAEVITSMALKPGVHINYHTQQCTCDESLTHWQ